MSEIIKKDGQAEAGSKIKPKASLAPDRVATAVDATSQAIDGVVSPETIVESPEQQLNIQGLALLKDGRIDQFNNLRIQNIKWSPKFSNCNLSGANLTGANLTGADLFEVILSRAELFGATLFEANLTRANLTRANLTRATLFGATLFEANLSEANFTEANLTEANLTGANLSGADLSGADLSKAKNLTPEQLSCACFNSVIINADQESILEEALRLVKDSVKVRNS